MITALLVLLIVVVYWIGTQVTHNQAGVNRNNMEIAWETQRLLGEILKELKKRG